MLGEGSQVWISYKGPENTFFLMREVESCSEDTTLPTFKSTPGNSIKTYPEKRLECRQWDTFISLF